MIIIPYEDQTINTTHGGAFGGLTSGNIDFIFNYYFILPERIPYVTVISQLEHFK